MKRNRISDERLAEIEQITNDMCAKHPVIFRHTVEAVIALKDEREHTELLEKQRNSALNSLDELMRIKPADENLGFSYGYAWEMCITKARLTSRILEGRDEN